MLATVPLGCTSLPPLDDSRPVTTAWVETADTALGRAVRQLDPGRPGHSGIFTLVAPHDAFAARVSLIRAAERSLDIQYYIWHPDTTGQLLLDEVRRAAERGVRVRLLLDDNGIAGLDPDLAVLDAHPNIEVRLFNPFRLRRWKLLGYLTDFRRLNHRMHNKSLTADTQATIVGGRNIGDAYFGADPQLDFADLDVLGVGTVARDVAQAFDLYWNSPSSYPADYIIAAAPPGAAQAQAQRWAALQSSPDALAYLAAVQRTRFVEQMLARELALEWVPVRVVYDPPAKVERTVAEPQLLLAQITQAMGTPRRELDLVSPYFVPGDAGTEALARYPGQGVQLRVVTNSLAATDVAAVHAGYAKRRKALLRAGVRLYELRPDPAPAPKATGQGVRRALGSSAASLHGKTFAVDRERVFVGSFNLDPRSIHLNTEMGLVIESPALASTISKKLDSDLGQRAYEVRLRDDGGGLEWIEETDAGPVRHDREPKAGLVRRLTVRLLSWLPIEGLL
ncbi:phospholipase D family protein [Caldimonas brevitalea]|uniref:Cardiolipin synthetase n=1 Tax=Caldimonas brevitalea TaxID=413882 RepID=A0A0G3BTL8_9BURK|nr:phospholipase D family protein [Caldimonas brevitalea]AKJ29855.1 cardiolipin synthetase [Caldimonas brevitalea]